MRARRIPAPDLGQLTAADLVGAVLLAPVRLAHTQIRKGTSVDAETADQLLTAARAGELLTDVRLAWPEPGDLHEDTAAQQLALAVAGIGIEPRAPRQSRLDLVARWDGVLHVRVDALSRLNRIDPLEVFTLYHGQAVATGQVVGSIKVAPHLLPAAVVHQGVRLAKEEGPLVEVRPYLPLEVGAIALEALSGEALQRFEAGARMKLEALGSRFTGTTIVAVTNAARAEADVRSALVSMTRQRALRIVLVGGVSAGDPLSPFYAALESLGGRVLRHGVPAHPGSMIWLGELDQTRVLGLPQCGMFTLATAADLILPRLLTGEALGAAELADLAHGGILGVEMRFRFPAYARSLESPGEPP
jgi:molybdenum cofactor cytidylyltransferase